MDLLDFFFLKLLEQGGRVGLQTVVFMESQHSVYEFQYNCFITACLRRYAVGAWNGSDR